MMTHFPGHVPRTPAAGTTSAYAADAPKPTDPPTGQWAV